jgi:hypothetical protein
LQSTAEQRTPRSDATQDAAMQHPSTTLPCSEFMMQARAAHARLSSALSNLLEARRVNDRLCRQWAQFEADLLNQLRAEEELLLPGFDLAHHADAARVRNEHNELRRLLIAIEQALGACKLDEQALSSLETLLSRNRSFQEGSLFAWSQQCLRPRTRGEFQARTSERRRQQLPARGSCIC